MVESAHARAGARVLDWDEQRHKVHVDVRKVLPRFLKNVIMAVAIITTTTFSCI